MWQFIDRDGNERGWFNDEDKKEFENHPDLKDGTWRKIGEEEVQSFNRWVGRLAYEQS